MVFSWSHLSADLPSVTCKDRESLENQRLTVLFLPYPSQLLFHQIYYLSCHTLQSRKLQTLNNGVEELRFGSVFACNDAVLSAL